MACGGGRVAGRRHRRVMLTTRLDEDRPLATFQKVVDGLVAEAAPRCPTFEGLVLALPGVLPDEALASLRRLSQRIDVDRLVRDAATDRCDVLVNQVAVLPLPHPLDSEYRFDAATASRLAAILLEATRPGDELLLVGTPTVALELALSGADRRLRFIGSDDCVTTSLALACGDQLLLGRGEGCTAAAALVDPPWYSPAVASMAATCALGVQRGAPVWMVVPTYGARPGADIDRAEYLRCVTGLGLETTEDAGGVRYRTPLFELAALAAQGIGRLSAWRAGEAVLLVANGEACAPAPGPVPRPCELTVAGVRLRVLGDNSPNSGLVPVKGCGIFPSVSSRAQGRDTATLWTSGHRAFSVDTARARSALTALSADRYAVWRGRLTCDGNSPNSFSGVADEDQLIHQLAELVEREVSDARRLVGDGAWLDTAMDWRC